MCCGCTLSLCYCFDVSPALRATPVRWQVMTSRCSSSFVRRGNHMCWRLCLHHRVLESALTSKSTLFLSHQPVPVLYKYFLGQHVVAFVWKHFFFPSDWVRVWMMGKVLSQTSAAERLSFTWSQRLMNLSGRTTTSVAPKAMISAKNPVLIG